MRPLAAMGPLSTAIMIVVIVMAALPLAGGFVVVGYVPDWRWRDMVWAPAVRRTTHLVLLGLEPKADGDIVPESVQRLKYLLQPNTPLVTALESSASQAPRIIAGIGGQGRSQHFAAMTSSQKARKKLAKSLVRLFKDVPRLSGVELNWETPKTSGEYRDLGKLAVEIRSALQGDGEASSGNVTLSMSYHPLVGAVRLFSQLQSKTTGKKFVELFDFCHSIAYSKYDEAKRHSSFELAQGAIEEWVRVEGLPRERMTLGIPFFGISRTRNGEHLSYAQILDLQPSLARQPDVDETDEGSFFFNGIGTVERKVQLAGHLGIAGVAIWELAQDKPSNRDGSGTLLRAVWSAAVSTGSVQRGGGAVATEGLLGPFYDFAARYMPWLDEDMVILGLAVVFSAYYSCQCLFAGPPLHRKLAAERLAGLPPRPPPQRAQEREAKANNAAESEVAENTPDTADGDADEPEGE